MYVRRKYSYNTKEVMDQEGIGMIVAGKLVLTPEICFGFEGFPYRNMI